MDFRLLSQFNKLGLKSNYGFVKELDTTLVYSNFSLIGSNNAIRGPGGYQIIGIGDGTTTTFDMELTIGDSLTQFDIIEELSFAKSFAEADDYIVHPGGCNKSRPQIEFRNPPNVGRNIEVTFKVLKPSGIIIVDSGTANWQLSFYYENGLSTDLDNNLASPIADFEKIEIECLDVRFTCVAQPATTGPTFFVYGHGRDNWPSMVYVSDTLSYLASKDSLTDIIINKKS